MGRFAHRCRSEGVSCAAGFACVLQLVACVHLQADAFAGIFPVGPEFQVNTTEATSFGPGIAADGSGNFVVVWSINGSSFLGGSDSAFSVEAQRFDSASAPLGAEFQVNSYTTNKQSDASVATNSSGTFVVVWSSEGSSGADSSDLSIQGQRFDGTGVPVGTEFQVNTYTTDAQSDPSVAMDGAGNFTVVWTSSGSSGSDSFGRSIQGQRYDSTGSPIGAQFQVNSTTGDNQRYARIAADGLGNFVVVWTSPASSGSDSSSLSIQGQRFDSAGLPLGTEFQVNTYTTYIQYDAHVAADGSGNFVVVWTSYGSSSFDSSRWSIQGQRFDVAGLAVGSEFQINTYTSSNQVTPRVAAAPSGDFLVTWKSDGSSGSDDHLGSTQGQYFDSVGQPVGVQFQVNKQTLGGQLESGVATDSAGNFVVVWESVDFASIRGQRFSTASLCGATPEPDSACRTSRGGKSSLRIRNNPDDSRDSLTWNWKGNEATLAADFKMPDTGAATHRLCIYDGSAGPQPLLEADIPNGAAMPSCNGDTCWAALPNGFKYANSSATPGGIQRVRYVPGPTGRSRVQIKSAGALLGPPETAGLTVDVVVQLLIDDGLTTECFKASFPGSSGLGGVQKQTATSFKAKGS